MHRENFLASDCWIVTTASRCSGGKEGNYNLNHYFIMTDSAVFNLGGVSLKKWIEGIGKTPDTAYKWIEMDMLETINILGNHYVTKEQDERFWSRAKAGEFAKEVLSVEEKVSRMRERQAASPKPQSRNRA
jgi:hypothetical protein